MDQPDRRSLLAGAAGLLLGAAAPAPASLAQVTTASGRKSQVTVWTPERPRGVVLFGHGQGSWPDRYVALASRLVGAGFAVAAPMHVDSVHNVDHAKYPLPVTFMERRADMKALGAYADERWPGLPLAAAGHSMGTLIALCLGGALPKMGSLRNPAVLAVLGFSTPGRIPGLVPPDAYATLAVPTMIVTGEADVVPGFAADWRDHLFPIESSPPGDKAALIVTGAEHTLAGGQPPKAFGSAVEHATAFLQAHVLSDPAARRRLARAPDTRAERWIRR